MIIGSIERAGGVAEVVTEDGDAGFTVQNVANASKLNVAGGAAYTGRAGVLARIGNRYGLEIAKFDPEMLKSADECGPREFIVFTQAAKFFLLDSGEDTIAIEERDGRAVI